MKSFKLWTGGNVELNDAVVKHAINIGIKLDVSLEPRRNRDIACYGYGTWATDKLSAMGRRREFFDEQPQKEISLIDFFSLDGKRTIFNPITGEKVEVSEESYQALKDSFKD